MKKNTLVYDLYSLNRKLGKIRYNKESEGAYIGFDICKDSNKWLESNKAFSSLDIKQVLFIRDSKSSFDISKDTNLRTLFINIINKHNLKINFIGNGVILLTEFKELTLLDNKEILDFSGLSSNQIEKIGHNKYLLSTFGDGWCECILSKNKLVKLLNNEITFFDLDFI